MTINIFAAASGEKSAQRLPSHQQKSLTLPLTGSGGGSVDPEMRFPCTLFTPKSEETLDDASSSNRVGHSVFYDCIDASPACVEEKQDAMKPEKGDTTDEEGE